MNLRKKVRFSSNEGKLSSKMPGPKSHNRAASRTTRRFAEIKHCSIAKNVHPPARTRTLSLPRTPFVRDYKNPIKSPANPPVDAIVTNKATRASMCTWQADSTRKRTGSQQRSDAQPAHPAPYISQPRPRKTEPIFKETSWRLAGHHVNQRSAAQGDHARLL